MPTLLLEVRLTMVRIFVYPKQEVSLMSISDDLYCKIFVDSDISREDLTTRIANLLSAFTDVRTICTPICEIDVLDNDDFDERSRKQLNDVFLYYRYHLEIFPVVNTHRDIRDIYVQTISQILNYLWNSSFDAVAACDFEDELPRRGGYVSDGTIEKS